MGGVGTLLAITHTSLCPADVLRLSVAKRCAGLPGTTRKDLVTYMIITARAPEFTTCTYYTYYVNGNYNNTCIS